METGRVTPTLIITNGDSAAESIRSAGLEATILPWRDVLHEGPVPGGLDLAELSELRARFISDLGWGAPEEVSRDFRERDAALKRAEQFDEVVLWFEHDLYDQLQLIQLLAWWADEGPETTSPQLVVSDEFISRLEPPALIDLFAGRRAAAPEQVRLGKQVWEAFRADDPRPLASWLERETRPLPFLRSALGRLLEEYPGWDDGLSRTERQILQLLDDGLADPMEIFRRNQALEEAPYLGDLPFWSYLEDLRRAGLIETSDARPFEVPGAQELRLGSAGRRVLAGEVDRFAIRPPDRWLGGVRIDGRSGWRWNRTERRIISVSSTH